MEKYNGWKNRSTWLVKLHLDNTNEEVAQKAYEIAVEANTKKQFENRIKILLLDIPNLEKEQDYDIRTVDFNEIWNSLAGYNK